jgi:hypothetical protein
MIIDRTTFLILAAGIATLAAACDSHPSDEHGSSGSSGAGHSSVYPACDAIIKACHAKDVGVGPVNDCHSIAHDAKSDDPCIPKKDECLKTCADAVVDGGVEDGG